MSDADPTLLRRLEAAHYRIVGALYGCRSRLTAHGLWIRSDHVDDPEWNHLGRLESAGEEGRASRGRNRVLPTPDEVLDTATERARQAGRRPTVALSSLSRRRELVGALERRGWQPSYRHVWLIAAEAPDARGVDPDPPPGVTIHTVSGAAMLADFLDVFREVFAAGDAEGAAGYRAALEASTHAGDDTVVVHYLAACDGAPCGIASAVYVDGVAGGFNLGVLPRARGRGVGAALTARRRARARRAGNDLVYLITEDPAVEASQLRRGHRRAMTTEGWSLQASSPQGELDPPRDEPPADVEVPGDAGGERE